jgi:hypothetical protein
MATFVTIPVTEAGDQGDCETYPTDTAEQIEAAKAALREHGLESRPVYTGDPDGESQRNGQILWAR